MEAEEYESIVSKAKAIFEERQTSYGNSVDEIDIHTVVGLMRMKMFRLYKEGIQPKTEDELLDTINYAVFALDKFYRGDKK